VAISKDRYATSAKQTLRMPSAECSPTNSEGPHHRTDHSWLLLLNTSRLAALRPTRAVVRGLEPADWLVESVIELVN